jgi:hypothetical protein
MPKAHGQKKVETVMREFKHGTLHSGSSKGPKVTSRKQAIAIAMSEAGLSKGKRKGRIHKAASKAIRKGKPIEVRN